MYPPELVMPMKGELTEVGFEDWSTPEQVISGIEQSEGTLFLVVNSVCGCAAGNARPAAKFAVSAGDKRPSKIATVFAGFDTQSVQKAREYFGPYPPSSPSMALFKDGKLVHFIERHNIEGRHAQEIANELIDAFDEFC